MVAIQYAPGGLRVIGACDGPTENGCCPLVVAGEKVPCCGLEIVLSKDDGHRPAREIGSPRFRVTPGSTACPLANATAVTRTPSRDYFSPFVCRWAVPQPA